MSELASPLPDPEWRIEPTLVAYPHAVATMEARVEAIRAGRANELVWLLEHPPLYTAGTSAEDRDLIEPDRLPVYRTGRGGRFTYHGPGQRIGYVLLDLDRRGRDIRCYVASLEGWLIDALAVLGVTAFQAPGRVGVWTVTAAGEAKIAAIGVRVRRWVTMHGFAINVAPDLEQFTGIVPCGLSDYPVTSLAVLQHTDRLADVDAALHATFPQFVARLNG